MSFIAIWEILSPILRRQGPIMRGGCFAIPLAGVLIVLSGCQAPGDYKRCLDPARQAQRISQLSRDIHALDDRVDGEESRDLAELLIQESVRLRHDFRMIRPAFLHNIFVNSGLRERGLCWHWMEDLLKKSSDLDLQTLQLRAVCAHPGSHMREHNALAVGTDRIPGEEWLVLDGWRYSGCLYWTQLNEDKYPWQFIAESGNPDSDEADPGDTQWIEP